jgi:hypothetical protein
VEGLEGRLPYWGTCYEWQVLEMGISLHGGSVGQPGVGSSTGDFEKWLKGALDVGHLSLSLSLYGSSVKVTWKAPLLGTLEDR